MSDLCLHLEKLGLPSLAELTLNPATVESTSALLQKLVLRVLEESVNASRKLELLQLRQRRSVLGLERCSVMQLAHTSSFLTGL